MTTLELDAFSTEFEGAPQYTGQDQKQDSNSDLTQQGMSSMSKVHFADRTLETVVATATPAIEAAGQAFNEYLWAEIPICEKMQIRALPFAREQFVLYAPLQPNRNVHGTAFAGSLYTVMSMAGWGLIRMELDRQIAQLSGKRADLWLTKANIRYADPVTTGYAAVAETDTKSLDQFWQKMVRKGRGKMRLNTVIGDPKRPLVTVQGEYAAKLLDC
jgi:thioesterase domain-containing protein